ncbi:MAG: hypothetical protein ACI4LX_12115 [Treponema sp.]
MKIKKIFIFFISFFLFLSAAFSEEENLKGYELSDAIYSSVSAKKYRAQKIQLSRTTEEKFPYNILITIQKTETDVNSAFKEFDTVLLSFTQEDIVKRMDFLFNLIEYNLNTDFNFNVRILLTACDKQELSGNESMTGSNAYCKLIEGTEGLCALCINLDSEKTNSITPGSAKKVCPLWLVKTTAECFEQNEIPVSIKGNIFMSLYSSGIFQSSQRLSSYLSRNFPAAELNLTGSRLSDDELNSLFKTFLEQFACLAKFQSDVHYIPVKISNSYYWIGEHITIIFLLILTTVSLAVFCDLGFIFRKRHSFKTLNTKRTVRSFYIIPVTIIVLTLCLLFGQFVASLFYRTVFRNPLIILGIKFIISLVLISFAYLFELKLHKRKFAFVYEYMLMISSLLNIFIFSAIDVSLFYLFTLIYLIIFISRFFKNTAAIYFFLMLSFIPYFLLITQVIVYSSPQQIYPLLFGDAVSNLILSCASTPFCLMLLRIYILIAKDSAKKIQKPQDNAISELDKINRKLKKRFQKSYAFIQILTVLFFGLIIILASGELRKQFSQNVEFRRQNGIIEESYKANLLKASYSDSNYYGGTIRKIFIDAEKKPLRIEVFVSGQTDNPVFYTAYTYSQTENSNQVQFDLPDYPPEKFEISYTPDNSLLSTVDILAYYDKKDYPKENSQENEDSADPRHKTFIRERVSLSINISRPAGQI